MIGIFGDSFAYEGHGSHVNVGWPTYLSDLYNEENQNFSISGSSIPYSYQLLCEKYLSIYSKVIFIATEPRRLHFVDKKTNKEMLWNGRDVPGSIICNSVDTYSSYDTSYDGVALRYQEYITAMYPDSWKWMAKAMRNDVVRKHENLLLLDIFELSFISNLGAPDRPWHIDWTEDNNIRSCHMTKLQNRELAGYIKDYFDNGFDIHNTLKSDTVKEYYTEPLHHESGFVKK